MQKIAVMTDSNCGMLPDKGKKLGISIVPMPVLSLIHIFIIAAFIFDQFCKCGAVAVDGGKDYLRRVGSKEDYEELVEYEGSDDDEE